MKNPSVCLSVKWQTGKPRGSSSEGRDHSARAGSSGTGVLDKVLFSLNIYFKPAGSGSERKSVQAQSPKSKLKVLFQTASDLLK